jgi:UDP-N-acetylglucosamine--N-acetylmuramyl-(pentapeptide) pyrophosphoryl-undecaprenol N-acetylglucosamine transferase
MTRVLIAAGGTVGHVAPALAVADELRSRGVDVVFAGTPDRVEARLVPARGYPFEAFRVSGFERRLSVRLCYALGQAAQAPVACSRILARVKPDVVLGAGGYVAGPMVAAAAARRLPAVVCENDSHLGLANRLAAPLARRVLLAFPIVGLDPPKYRVIGRPVDPAFFATSRSDARKAFGIDPDAVVVVVVGGSLGAGAINTVVASLFGGEPRPGAPLVLHVTGRGKLAGIEPNDQYRVFEYCETMPQLFALADVVVSRAGGSVFEIAAAGRPAILVPWSAAAADHQTGNAAFFAAAHAATVIRDVELDGERLAAAINRLVHDPARRAAMSDAMRRIARPDAATAVADELIAAGQAPQAAA